jgi:hypothetical protein
MTSIKGGEYLDLLEGGGLLVFQEGLCSVELVGWLGSMDFICVMTYFRSCFLCDQRKSG